MWGSLIVELSALIQSGTSMLAAVLRGVTDNLPQILAIAADVLATLVDGLAEQLPTLLPVAMAMVLTLVQGVIDNLPKIIESGLNLLAKFTQGVIDAIPQLVEALPKIITGFVNGIGRHMPQIIETGLTLLGKLIVGIVKAIPRLIAALPQIIRTIWDGLTQVDWGGLGRDMINGIKNGLMNAGGAIKDAIVGLDKGAWKAVKNFFGIASPSRLMRDTIGVMVGKGLADGIIGTGPVASNAVEGLADQAFDAFDAQSARHPLTLDARTRNERDRDTAGTLRAQLEATPQDREGLTRDDVLEAVKEALQSMPALQLLLDNRVVAGELAPYIDKTLGRRTVRGY